MSCLFIISASVFCTSSVLSDPLTADIKRYFNSDNVKTIRKVWKDHRESVEHALENALQDNMQNELKALNMKPSDLRLANAYYHKQGPVEVIFENIDLVALPRSLNTHVSLELDLNILKIKCSLTEMVINADYWLMRNISDIIQDVVNQDPYRRSPFLLKEVRNTGKITIWINGCVLSGYVIARLKGGTVHLVHEKLSLNKCTYAIKIYNKDSNVPPFITHYSVIKPPHSLGIKHFLLKPITQKFVTKLQSAISHNINTSSIFGRNISIYEKEQKILFNKTLSNLTTLIKEHNQKIVDLNDGKVNLADYKCTWDYIDTLLPNKDTKPAEVKISKMILSGLNTAIYSHTGGPYKDNTVMLGERKLFRKLQVSGEILSTSTNALQFSVNIRDFAINVDIDVEPEGIKQANMEAVSYRNIKFVQPNTLTTPIQALITGYLLDVVPHAIIKTIAAVATNPVLTYVNKEYKIQNMQAVYRNSSLLATQSNVQI